MVCTPPPSPCPACRRARLLPIPLAYYAVKRLLVSSGLAAFLADRLGGLAELLRLWVEEKQDLLFPPPVTFLARLSYAVERRVLGGVIQHLDSIVTALMILAMVLPVVAAAPASVEQCTATTVDAAAL